jgi:acetylornithine deacetylase
MGRALAGDYLYEHRVTAYLEDFFRGLGVAYERQPVAPRRDNILARYDPPTPPPVTLVLEVHQDTVPTDAMTIDPFGGAVAGGRLSGRGSCDVKAGMAAMLAAFARLVQERPAGSAAVVLACSVDEEHTFLGVQEMVRRGLKADLAVVAEPTNLKIVRAHKGVTRWDVRTTGRACHSSRPDQGVNAIYRMGRLLTAVERYADGLARSASHPLLGPPTISVGRIEGGVSANTVPDGCRIELDRRLLPGESAAEAPAQLEAYLTAAGIDFPVRSSAVWLACPALGADANAAAVERLGRAVDAVRGGHEVTTVPYGTDASSLAAAGIPSVVFGPGDIAQAHTCDEWVDLSEVEQAAEVYYRLAAD